MLYGQVLSLDINEACKTQSRCLDQVKNKPKSSHLDQNFYKVG